MGGSSVKRYKSAHGSCSQPLQKVGILLSKHFLLVVSLIQVSTSFRPKQNEKFREELEKAVHIIWNCGLPSPRCVAVDAVVETDLVSALQVSVFPEIIFTKAGKILYREKGIRTADELSKIMAFFYYGAAKPPCLNGVNSSQEQIPLVD
ncbi:unnamed protein product [Arabis nemorensis]|uniref:Thioredoxin domain-containing protein n=1 Tax=Arabis nemorensis TaxID=586526 RepID=A0A565C1E8_9BRAS|nr:unnamed protein product [Arabis nemorensis]